MRVKLTPRTIVRLSRHAELNEVTQRLEGQTGEILRVDEDRPGWAWVHWASDDDYERMHPLDTLEPVATRNPLNRRAQTKAGLTYE